MAVKEARLFGRSRVNRLDLGSVPETFLYLLSFLAAAVILALLAVVLLSTFQEGLPELGGRLSLGNYREALGDSFTYRAGLNSLLLGAGTVAVNLFFAVPMAWIIHRTDLPYKNLFLTLMYIGVAIPGFLRAIAWILLLSPKIGLLNQFLRILWPGSEGPLSIYNLPGMAFVQGLMLAPVMFFMISAPFTAIDPQLEESADVCGARWFVILKRVTGPLILPALAAAVIYNFMSAVSIFEIPALLGLPARIQVLSTLLFFTVNTDVGVPQYGLAGVYGVLLVVPMLIGLFFYQRLLRKGYRYGVVTGKGYRRKLMNLGRWKWVAVGFLSFFFLLNLVLPFLVLVWTSLIPFIQLPSAKALSALSLDGYHQALGVLSGRPLLNTVVLMVVVAAVVLFFSTIISWIVLRSRLPGRYFLDTVTMLPHATPSLAFAFAISYVALSLARVVPLNGTLAVIIIAHIVTYISYGTRTINGSLIQIHQDLEDAVTTSGGSKLTVLHKVILPLLSPALFYCGLWVALLSYREVTMALFLQSPRNMVISTAIWNLWAANKPAEAAALGVITFGVAAVGVLFLLRTAGQFVYGLRSG